MPAKPGGTNEDICPTSTSRQWDRGGNVSIRIMFWDTHLYPTSSTLTQATRTASKFTVYNPEQKKKKCKQFQNKDFRHSAETFLGRKRLRNSKILVFISKAKLWKSQSIELMLFIESKIQSRVEKHAQQWEVSFPSQRGTDATSCSEQETPGDLITSVPQHAGSGSTEALMHKPYNCDHPSLSHRPEALNASLLRWREKCALVFAWVLLIFLK